MKIDRDLYEDTILDHNRNPFHYMFLPQNSNHKAYGFNPLCGDEFTINLRIADGVIQEAGFEGVGCAISVASTSMMIEVLEGLNMMEATALAQRMMAFFHGEVTSSHDAELPPGQLALLGGVFDHPERIKCANLAWFILHAALQKESNTVCTE
ncbi:Fe-S cluster assembly sulfur transfer protein SufU [Candidatus Magnetaquicoccus inordinatus]|uniref:Fe-S cluster assembly sulfur transfer protein SufU n=1 Tax=Candidatus Magnetaquicoccus inordinatus TaxID=2496818 RepID=UPI00102B615C|nr:SUF system NifU family Fe-S cluster assembly protein [Candidatus Magnetaquicoccus inordinatus]